MSKAKQERKVKMKRLACFLLLNAIVLTETFSLTNGEAIRNISLLVRRWNDWKDRCVSYWESQLTDGKYSDSGSFEDHVYQMGAINGIAATMSELIDHCISLNLAMVERDAYRWLTEEYSDFFYNFSQRPSWYDGLSAEEKKIYDLGYFRGTFSISEESSRFPNIWEWKHK